MYSALFFAKKPRQVRLIESHDFSPDTSAYLDCEISYFHPETGIEAYAGRVSLDQYDFKEIKNTGEASDIVLVIRRK